MPDQQNHGEQADEIMATVTARDANGTRYTIERWTTHATRPGDAWRDGASVLRTTEGTPVYDMTEGRYEFGDTGTLLYADQPDTNEPAGPDVGPGEGASETSTAHGAGRSGPTRVQSQA